MTHAGGVNRYLAVTRQNSLARGHLLLLCLAIMPAPAPHATLVRQPSEEVDEAGNRTVHHRGEGLRLSSFVNPKGRLLRATLVVGNEVVAWQHGAPLRTGLLARTDSPIESAEFDKRPSGMRLERARQAIGGYSGDDRYIKQMGRLLLITGGLASADVVTQHGVDDKAAKRRRAEKAKAALQRKVLAGLGITLLAAIAYAVLR